MDLGAQPVDPQRTTEWTQLSCHGSNVVLSQIVPSAQGSAASLYAVQTSNDGGSSWTAGPSMAGAETSTKAASPASSLASLANVAAAGSSSDVLVGFPSVGADLATASVLPGQARSSASRTAPASVLPVPHRSLQTGLPTPAKPVRLRLRHILRLRVHRLRLRHR